MYPGKAKFQSNSIS